MLKIIQHAKELKRGDILKCVSLGTYQTCSFEIKKNGLYEVAYDIDAIAMELNQFFIVPLGDKIAIPSTPFAGEDYAQFEICNDKRKIKRHNKRK